MSGASNNYYTVMIRFIEENHQNSVQTTVLQPLDGINLPKGGDDYTSDGR